MVIDLPGILNGNQAADILVEDGDKLFVPKFSNTVAVIGEVYEPGTFRFDEGLTVDQYIEIAGGSTNYALNRNTYLLKADGSVKFFRNNALKSFVSFEDGTFETVEAGDVIVIPTNLDYDTRLNRATAITERSFQSLSSVAAFLAIANN